MATPRASKAQQADSQVMHAQVAPVAAAHTTPTILLADDDRVLCGILGGMLEQQGYAVVETSSGEEAYAWLLQNPTTAAAALVDREMPGLDGLSLVQMMKKQPQLALLPVVMVTGASKPEQVREGINAGVFYYLTKPVEGAVLEAVTARAVAEGRRRRAFQAQLSRQHGSLAMLYQGVFALRTIAQAEQLALELAGLFPQPERVVQGLVALLLNAVEHGLLQVGYELKGHLLANGTWKEEIMQRESLPENQRKRVRVAVERGESKKGGMTRITIQDPGAGFDWRSFIDFSSDRAGAPHGRGIAQARASGFDKLSYNQVGNIVQAEAGLRPELVW